jgi:hypothetical protein
MSILGTTSTTMVFVDLLFSPDNSQTYEYALTASDPVQYKWKFISSGR